MRYRCFGALLLAVPLSAAGISAAGKSKTAAADSVPPYWAGSDGMGAILAGDECPIEVEREHLRFSLSEFPAKPMETAEDFAKYSGKFTAEYTFYNPTDETVDLALVFPFGTLPEYFPCSEKGIDRSSFGYQIQQDGKDVSYVFRHTLDGVRLARGGTSFNPEQGLERLYGPRKAFFQNDTPVTVYTYRIETLRQGTDDSDFANFAISFEASAERTRVFCSDNCNISVKNGKAKLTHSFDCAGQLPLTLSVFVLGEDISGEETCVFRYEGEGSVVDENASVTLESRTETTFSELALSFRGKESAVSDVDWKNAFLDAVEEQRYLKTCCSGFVPLNLDAPDALMQWFEYTLSIPAKGRTVNSVTAPIYPTVNGAYPQDLYSYRYLLSPAQKWAKFGRLTVDIDTPFYISDSSLSFTAREGGYTFTRETLPLGELDFTLTEQERQTDADAARPYNGGNGTMVTAIVIVCVVIAGAAVVTVILAVQSAKKKKRREEEEKRLLQTRPQEGKIDLPESPGDGQPKHE